jgi:hypothetical protein
MASFVDPRLNPQPSERSSGPELAASRDQVEALHQFCREGRLYDVENWIKAGRPLQVQVGAPGHRMPTALQIAMETGQHSLLLLLLCNSYRLDIEPVCPLTQALGARRWDYVDLFWTWGADPRQVSTDIVFDTYISSFFDRFEFRGQNSGIPGTPYSIHDRHDMGVVIHSGP